LNEKEKVMRVGVEGGKRCMKAGYGVLEYEI
jgi:hypothetical protein